MMKILFSTLFFYSSLILYANPELKDNGGYHFKFTGSDYIFLMTTNGQFKFFPMVKNSEEKTFEREEGFSFNYCIKKNNGKGPQDYRSIETEEKSSKSSFTLIVKLETVDGVKSSLLFKGDRRQMMISVGSKLPESYRNGVGFAFWESPNDYQKGMISTLSKTKKVIKHPCYNTYAESHYKSQLKVIDIQKRLGMNVNIDIKGSKGKLSMMQISHNRGATLNKEFRISYGNNELLWPQKENMLVLKFS